MSKHCWVCKEDEFFIEEFDWVKCTNCGQEDRIKKEDFEMKEDKK